MIDGGSVEGQPLEVGKLGEGGRLIQVPNALTFQYLIKFEKK